jgi:ATP-dependent Clp protease protease subunit
MATPGIQLPEEIYATLAGTIDQSSIQRILNSFSTASLNNVKKAHILLQCSGGGIGEGICLYNFFKTAPMDIVIYNGGTIASIGVIAYLGAKNRKASRNSMFMIHRTQTTTQSATTQTIKAFAESAVLFDRNTEGILREHIHMSEDKWAHFNHNDLWFSAEDAVKFGIAEEIADFSPPNGTKLYNI